MRQYPEGSIPDDLRGVRQAVEPILRRAGAAALAHFRTAPVEFKPDGTEVTIADRVAEEVIVEGLAQRFPDSGIVGEEGARVGDRGAGTWHVDPIDGTSAFIEGLAEWGPTVCWVRDGRVVFGAFYLPRLGELWWAVRGGGAYVDANGRTDRLRPTDPPAIGPSHALYLPSRFHHYPVAWPGRVRAFGSSAYHLAQVAYGGGGAEGAGAVATVIPRWALWDVGCGLLLVEEAGRVAVDLSGAAFSAVTDENRPFVAGAPVAVAAIVASRARRVSALDFAAAGLIDAGARVAERSRPG
jgi:myo-inositol-1(or 4)-monophosphatase